MVKVKVCGITNLEDAQLACGFGADALGFIFYQKSPRFVSPVAAKSIIDSLPPFVGTVGVFVNALLSEINQILKTVPIKLIQLHGDESSDYCRKIPLPALKVFRVKNSFDLSIIKKYKTSGFLLDTYHDQSYGGTGETFNWNIAKEAKKYGPIVVSGGLSAKNVREAVEFVHPYAVDVCSGVEAEPGKKDSEKLKAFFQEVRKTANHYE